MNAVIVFLVTLTIVPCDSRRGKVDTSVSADDWVRAHNKYRKMERASNMQTMVWSPELAKFAADYGRNCHFDHSSQGERRNIGGFGYSGENLAASTGGARSADNVVGRWASEKQYYNYNSNSCRSGKACGHYTQVVWAETCAVGCAQVFCPRMPIFTQDAYYTVCNYGPGGNYVGAKPYKSGSGGMKASQCKGGSSKGGSRASNTNSQSNSGRRKSSGNLKKDRDECLKKCRWGSAVRQCSRNCIEEYSDNGGKMKSETFTVRFRG